MINFLLFARSLGLIVFLVGETCLACDCDGAACWGWDWVSVGGWVWVDVGASDWFGTRGWNWGGLSGWNWGGVDEFG